MLSKLHKGRSKVIRWVLWVIGHNGKWKGLEAEGCYEEKVRSG